MSLYFRILSYIKPYLPRLIAAAICTVLAAAGNLYVPWIIKDVIDSVLAEKNAEMLNIIAAGIIIIFFIIWTNRMTNHIIFWYRCVT